MSRFATTIDLSQLVAPDAIAALDFEAILAELKADFKLRYPAFDLEALEVDPAVKIMEVCAYRELILRSYVNDKVRAILLSQAAGSDLDQLGVYYGVERATVTEATETEDAVMESDAELRRRIQLAPEAFSVAGPRGAYEFHALTADASIKSVGVYAYGDTGLAPGQVRVYLLTRTGNGVPAEPLVDKVRGYFRDTDDKIPATDMLSVLAAGLTSYAINVTLQIPSGPDPALIKTRAETALAAYAAARHAVGVSVPRSGISRAAFIDGVDNVIVNSPASDIAAAIGAAPWCTGVTVTTEVI